MPEIGWKTFQGTEDTLLVIVVLTIYMKQLAIINHFKQWKISYGENYYWKLGSQWYVEVPNGLQLISKELVAEIEPIWLSKIQTW